MLMTPDFYPNDCDLVAVGSSPAGGTGNLFLGQLRKGVVAIAQGREKSGEKGSS